MRAISLILAFAVVLATNTMAGTTPDSLPGAGMFSFELSAPVAQPVLVASR